MPDRRFAHPLPRTALVGAFALAIASPARALEIDELQLHTPVGHPLHARGRITGPGSENPLRTAVRCLEGACADVQLRSYVAGRAQQAPAVVLRSFSPLRSGFLRIEVEVADGESIARREFTLQLQSPGTGRRALPVSGVAAQRASPGTVAGSAERVSPRARPRGENLALPAAPAAEAEGAAGDERWVVQPGQTLSGIAAQLSRRHGGGTSVWMERLFTANPGAFIRADRNRIRAGATLRFDLPLAGIAEAEPQPAPAPQPEPQPEPQPTAPTLPATPPAPAAGATTSAAAAARETLAELSDDGKALAERLARLEARIRSLQAELVARESAIEELQQVARGSTETAADPEPTVAAQTVAPSASAIAQADDSVLVDAADSGEANEPQLPVAAEEQRLQAVPATTAVPARTGVDWSLVAGLGLVAIVLALALLLRRLARGSHAGSQPLCGDDHALRARIQERLESNDTNVTPPEVIDEGIDMSHLTGTVAATPSPMPVEDTVRLAASPMPAEGEGAVNEDEVVTEVDVKIVYGLFDEAEAVLVEALASVPLSPRLLLKLAEVRFYRRDADALAELASQVLAQGQRQPAWLWAKVERLGRELCPERAPFAQSPARPGLRSVG